MDAEKLRDGLQSELIRLMSAPVSTRRLRDAEHILYLMKQFFNRRSEIGIATVEAALQTYEERYGKI